MFSSIEEESREEVIQKCYWPIFELADSGVPIAIEAPAITLEIINKLDFEWITKLSSYIEKNKIEFIGSGYSQIIGPLVPGKVNEWNQKLGLIKYKQLLNAKPECALINEMAYSKGVVEHYIDNDYKAIIMEWNNPRYVNPDWKNEFRYHYQNVTDLKNRKIPLIWSDSIAFQQFQRYVHGENNLHEYIVYIKSHIGQSNRFLSLYSNDIEIFDFRPGRYKSEEKTNNYSEWDRIIKLFEYLKNEDWCNLIFPSEVLNNPDNGFNTNKINLETSSQPIPVKKQEKYNINRWALTGRDDSKINSKCYKIFLSYIKTNNVNIDDWKRLCYFWSSDFRTHITLKRWNSYYKTLDIESKKSKKINDTKHNSISDVIKFSNDEKNLVLESKDYNIKLNFNKGLAIESLCFKSLSKKPILGTLKHGYFDDISLGADFYSGHLVIERLGKGKVTNLSPIKPIIDNQSNSITIENDIEGFYFKEKFIFDNNKIKLEKYIKSDKLQKIILKPYHFTFNPKIWDIETLFLQTNCGSKSLEIFFLKGQNISHSNIYSSLISSRHGFGHTEGRVIIGDKNKLITFECDMSKSALIPSIIYKEINESFFFRLEYSAQEIDETLKAKKNELFSSLTVSSSS
jgi:hypothetical protein